MCYCLVRCERASGRNLPKGLHGILPLTSAAAAADGRLGRLQFEQQHTDDVADEEQVEEYRQDDRHDEHVHVRRFVAPASVRVYVWVCVTRERRKVFILLNC